MNKAKKQLFSDISNIFEDKSKIMIFELGAASDAVESQTYHVTYTTGREILVVKKYVNKTGIYCWRPFKKIGEKYSVVYEGAKVVLPKRKLRDIYDIVYATKAEQVRSR